MKPILRILLVLTVATIAGCYYDSEERLYPVLSTDCDLTNVTFSGTIKPILQASCLSCHSNAAVNGGEGGGFKLEIYEDVLTVVQSGQLMRSVRHESDFPMPKGGGTIPECEINQLQQWIDNDAQKN